MEAGTASFMFHHRETSRQILTLHEEVQTQTIRQWENTEVSFLDNQKMLRVERLGSLLTDSVRIYSTGIESAHYSLYSPLFKGSVMKFYKAVLVNTILYIFFL